MSCTECENELESKFERFMGLCQECLDKMIMINKQKGYKLITEFL